MIDLKNEAENAIHNTEKSLNEFRDKIGEQDITEIETEIQSLRNTLADENVTTETLKEEIEKVKNAAMKIGKAMYSQGGAQQSTEQDHQHQEEQNQEEGNQGEGNQQGNQSK